MNGFYARNRMKVEVWKRIFLFAVRNTLFLLFAILVAKLTSRLIKGKGFDVISSVLDMYHHDLIGGFLLGVFLFSLSAYCAPFVRSLFNMPQR